MKIWFIGNEAEKTFTYYDPELQERFRFYASDMEYNVPERIANQLIDMKPYLFGRSKSSILYNRGEPILKESSEPITTQAGEIIEKPKGKPFTPGWTDADREKSKAAIRKKQAAKKKVVKKKVG